MVSGNINGRRLSSSNVVVQPATGKRSRILALAAIGVVSGLLVAPVKAATTYSWTNGDTTGLWNSTSTTTDWKSATYPNAAGIIAQGPAVSAGAGTVNLNVNVTVGELKPGSTGGGASWNVSGASTGYVNTITMDATGLGANDFGDTNVAEIRDASGAGYLAINSNLAMANTDLDIGFNNAASVTAVIVGTLNNTTLINSGNTGAAATSHTLVFRGASKGGNASPSVIMNSAIGTSGSTMAISDIVTGGNVYLLGAVGANVTTVTNSGTVRLFLGNTGNAYTGDTTVAAGAIINIGAGYNADFVGQVVPFGAGKGNVVVNGTLELAGNSEQINALNSTAATGIVQSTSWDGFVGGGTAALTVGNGNANGAYAGNIVQTTAGRFITLTKTGTGTQVLTNSGNVLSAVTVSGGTLQIGDGTSASATVGVLFGTTTPTTVTDNANLAFNYNAAANAGNTITGTGSVTQMGSAPLTLTGAASTFSGGLNINSSSVLAGNANAGVLGSGTVTMAANTLLDVNGNSPTTGLVSSIANTAVVTNNGAANGVLTLSGTGNATFAGVIQAGATNTIGITKAGTGTQTFSGVSTYVGATTLNGGKLILTSTGGLGNTAITVYPSATLSVHPNSGSVSIGSAGSLGLGGTLTLAPGTGSSPGGAFDMLDGSIGTLNLIQQTGFSGSALTLGGSGGSVNAPTLNFELGSSSADLLNITSGSVNVGQTGAAVNISVLSGTSTLTAGNYTLINAPGGGLSPLTLAANSIVVGTTSYSLSLANSTSTQEILTIGTTGGAPVYAYFTGLAGSSFSSTGPANFAIDRTGATATGTIPGGGSNVFLTADNANTNNLSTTLDGAFNINSLTFTGTGTPAGTTPVTIAAGNGGSLTLTPTNAFHDSAGNNFGPGVGLVVQAGSAAHTISAPITLGASQTWEIDNAGANALTVSGSIADQGMGYTLNKTGTGNLILSGTNSYTGGTNISAGTLITGATGALPTNGPVTVNGGTLELNGFGQTIGTLSDGGVGTGTIINSGAAATLTINGASNSTYSGAFNAAASSLAVTGTASLLLSGNNNFNVLSQSAGSLTLSGTNTFAGSVAPNGGTMILSSTAALNGGTTGTVVVGDSGNLTDNGAPITVASFVTNSKATSTTTLNAGSVVNIAGVLGVDNDNGSNQGVLVINGATVNAASVTVGRAGLNFSNANGPVIQVAGSTVDGIYINGGSLNVTGALTLGNSAAANSSPNVRLDAGALNVGGLTTIAINNGRYSLLDIAGGTFNGAGGVQVGGNFADSPGEFLIRGTAVVNVPQIAFGNSVQTQQTDLLELLGGTLNLGAGGLIANGSTGTVYQVNMGGTAYATAPVLNATASFSTAIPFTLTNSSNGTLPAIQTGNASSSAVTVALTGPIGGAGGFIKAGGGTLVLTNGNFYTGITTLNSGILNINGQFALGGAVYGGTTFNGGTLQYATGSFPANANGNGDISQNSLNVAKPVTINGGGAIIDLNGNPVTFGATVGNNGVGGLTLVDSNVTPGSLTLAAANTYKGGTNVVNGTLNFAAPKALPNFSSLNISSGAVANAVANTGTKNTLFASGLSLAGASNAWTAKLDLANNDLVVQNGNLGILTNQVKQGYQNGNWNGTAGIVSSSAAVDSSHLTALGVIRNSADGTPTGTVLFTAFDGATASAATDILVKYTYYGDTDLNGMVDGSDYSRIDNAYTNNQTAGAAALTGWFNGDFNYDGVVDGSDYTLIDNAFNSQGAVIAAQLASPSALVGGSSAVPEPTTISLLGIAAAGLLGRRRRH